jgi:hypothetical protein
MTTRLAAVVLALALVGGAHAAGGGSISASVVANPLAVTLAVSPVQVVVGGGATATATVRNLGSLQLTGVEVTLRADPGLALGGGATRSLGTLAGLASGTVSFPICGLAAGNYLLVASATTGVFTSESAAQLLQVTAGSGQCAEDASAALPAGGTLSTDTEGDGASPSDPVETSVTTPVAGLVSIAESAATAPAATAFSFLGQQVQITAPAAASGNPLVIVFRLDASIAAVHVFRNGVALPDCPGDPCVAARSSFPDGDVGLTVRTSAASAWAFGTALHTRGAVAAALRTSNGHVVALLAASDGNAVAGTLAFDSYVAAQTTALAVSGRTAWLAGVGADRRPYLAYLEDNGLRGRNDVFKLWIAGVAQTTDGRLRSGDVAVAR